MDWLDLLAVQGTLKSLSNTTVQNIIFSALNLLYVPTLTSIHDYWKTIILTSQNLVSKVMSLLFNLLSSLVIAFLKASFNFIAAITICSDFGAQENKVFNCFHYFPICLHEVMGLNAMILVFWMLNFKPAFLLPSFIKRLFTSFSLSAIRWCHLHIWSHWYFSRQSWFQLVLLPAQRFSWCTLHRS